MKKTIRTAMTSAMFAAAIGVSAGNMPAGGASAVQNAAELPDEETLMTATMTEPVDVYGPPEYFSSLEEAQQTTVPEEELMPAGETVMTTAYDEPLRDESEAPMETTTLELGGVIPLPTEDWNHDGVLNAADLTFMKRALLERTAADFEGDLNYDGVFDKEDIKELRRRLTGKSKEQEDAEEAAATTTTTTVTEAALTTATEDIPQPDYGPMPYFE